VKIGALRDLEKRSSTSDQAGLVLGALVLFAAFFLFAG
jgi:hypothetical protein